MSGLSIQSTTDKDGLQYFGQGAIPTGTSGGTTDGFTGQPGGGLTIQSPYSSGGLTYNTGGEPIPTNNIPRDDIGGGGNNGNGGGAGVQQTAQQQEAAKLKKGRDSVTSLVNSIRGVYDALYGNLDTAAADKSQLINQRFDTENQSLTDQFQSQFGNIGRAFASRGAFDSGFRQTAEADAQKQFGGAIDQQNVLREGELAGVGQYLEEGRAGIQGGRDSLNLTLDQVAQSENVDEINQVINQLQARKVELQTQAAGTGPQNFYLQQLASEVPSSSRLAQARADITNIVSAQIPAPVKQQIISNLVRSSSLSAQEKEALLAEFTVTEQEEQVV